MSKYNKLPAISGKQLIGLIKKDGWRVNRQAKGVALAKTIGGRTKVTIIPNSSASLDGGTLAAILGRKQMNIGRRGLLDLINKYGI